MGRLPVNPAETKIRLVYRQNPRDGLPDARVFDLPLDLVFQYEAPSHGASGTPPPRPAEPRQTPPLEATS